MLPRPFHLLCALLATTGMAWAQTNVDTLLGGTDRAQPGSAAPIPGDSVPTPDQPTPDQPTAPPSPQGAGPAPTPTPPRTAADLAQAGTINPDASWAWVLARPGAVDDGHVLLAVDGPSRAVVVVAWDGQGRVTTFGASPDVRGQAAGDLAARMASKPAQDPPLDGRYWGVWSTTEAQEGAAPRAGSAVWAPVNSSLRAAVAGERTRARRMDVPGARAMLVVFPMPSGMALDKWDVEAGKEGSPSLQKPLAFMTDGAIPIPFSPLAGRPSGWDTLGPPGTWATYKGAGNRGWLFTVLDL